MLTYFFRAMSVLVNLERDMWWELDEMHKNMAVMKVMKIGCMVGHLKGYGGNL